jgi:hypothetical protein
MTDYAKYEGLIVDPDVELWNQSYYYNAYDPTTRIGCVIRIGLLPNQKQANNWLIVFADGLPVFARSNLNLPYTDARPADGLEIAGMKIQSVAPVDLTHISFADGDFAFELDWQSTAPMADCLAMTQEAESTFASEMATVHLEGPCSVTGHIVVRGERIELSGTGFRDIAAGPRNWNALQHYRTAWPIFANGMAFAGVHGMSTSGQSSYMRMFHDGRQWLRVNSFTETIEYGPDRFSVKSMQWTFDDETGREFTFTASPLFSWMFPLDTFVVAEQIMEYRLNDGTPGYGLSENGFRLPWNGNAAP